jgi:hypothetical protein
MGMKEPKPIEKFARQVSWVLRDDRRFMVAELKPIVTPVITLSAELAEQDPWMKGLRSHTKRFWSFAVVSMIQRWWKRVAPSRHLALHMAMHPRLGAESVLSQLPVDLLKKLVL